MKTRHLFPLLIFLILVGVTSVSGSVDFAPAENLELISNVNAPNAVDGRKRGDWLPLGTDWSDTDPAVAYSPKTDEYLVVFSTFVNPGREIRGVFVDGETGSKLGNGFIIADGDNWKDYPDVVYDSINNRFLVVWEEEACSGGFPTNCANVIKGRLIHGSYQSILSQFAGDTFTVASQIGVVSFDLHDPAAAFNADDGQFAVVFHQEATTDFFQRDIYGRMLAAHTSSPTPLGDNSGFLVWDYTTYLSSGVDIAWSDASAGTFLAVWWMWSDGNDNDIDNVSAAYIHDTYQGGATQVPSAYLIAPHASGDYPLTDDCSGASVAYDTNTGAFVTVFGYYVNTQSQLQQAPNAPPGPGIYGQRITPNHDAGTFRFDDQYAFPIETDPDMAENLSEPEITNSGETQEDTLVVYVHRDIGPVGDSHPQHLYGRSLVGDSALPRFLVSDGPEDGEDLGDPALACQYSECLVIWRDEGVGTSSGYDVLGQLLSSRDEILFDEAHDEQNTLDWTRAQEIVADQGGGQPDWYYFGDMEDALLGDYHFFVNEDDELNYENIDGYAALVLSVPREPLSSAEIKAIRKYVATGGGLVLIGDCGFNADEIYPGLHGAYGIDFKTQCLYAPKGAVFGDFEVADFEDHPAVEGVTEFNMNYGQSLSFWGYAALLASTDKTVWEDTNWNDEYDEGTDLFGQNFPVIVGADTGCGRVVAVSDNAFQDDGFEFRGNEALMRALLHWVTGGTTCEFSYDLFLPLILR